MPGGRQRRMSSINAGLVSFGSFALAAVIVLVFGSLLLRFVGVAMMVVPTVFLFSEASLDTADAGSYLVFVPMAVLGVMVWVLGHRWHAGQQRRWKSPVAAALWSVPGRVLSPSPGR